MRIKLSRARAEKTRSRERRAARDGAQDRPIIEKQSVGWCVCALLLLGTVLLLPGAAQALTERTPHTLLPLAGDSVLAALTLLAVGLLLQAIGSTALRNNARLLLLTILSILATAVGRGLLYVTAHTQAAADSSILFLLPLGFAPLLAGILLDRGTAMATGIWTSMLMALLAGRSLPVFAMGIFVSAVAAWLSGHLRTRANMARTGLLLGLAQFPFVLAATALAWQSTGTADILHAALASLGSGLLSAVLALLLLPVFEAGFRITTDFTLLQLCDLGHPLLQRLAMEAPGTYHHSLIVAQLAMAAADEIGANPLLARVGAYFHDVGKLTKPEFFSENIRWQHTNPHDDLPPSMSTLVITSHVKEGISLGTLYKLPEPVLAVIAEHHGTCVVSWFHHKATTQLELELAERKGTTVGLPMRVDESGFRYAGPKPSSRETAIVSLADAAEAASRSLEKATPGHIEGIVNDVVQRRLDDGQLDHSGLTLADLAAIRRSLVFSLTNMLHARIPYPKDEDRDSEPSTAVSADDADRGQLDA